MKIYMIESLTLYEDETMSDAPSPHEVNTMFKLVTCGPKKERMYGCGFMTSKIYPQEMNPRRRGVYSSDVTSNASTQEETNKLRDDLAASNARSDELEMKFEQSHKELLTN